MGTGNKNEILEQIKSHKGVFLLYIFLRIMVAVVMVRQFLAGNFQYVFLCILVLFLFIVPSLIEKEGGIRLPDTLEIIILLFIFAAEILGEIQEFYVQIPFWDTLLHTLNGFLAAAVGLSLVEILNNSERVAMKLSPFFIAVVAFCFSMTVGVMWEFAEFGADMLFGMDMQKDTVVHEIHSVMLDPAGGQTPYAIEDIHQVVIDGQEMELDGYLDIGLTDTMKDLFVNFIGAIVFSVGGYFSMKHGKGKNWMKNFVPEKAYRFSEGAEHMQEHENTMITVLLTRYYSTFSNFIYFVSGRGYTHASLALDDKNESYYSFNFRGFRKEYPKKYRHRSKSSISYTLEIPKEDYEKIREKIKEMEHGKEKFHYSRIGVLLCLLHIPFRRKNYYFCSQFVTEMLQMSDAVLLRKDASLYLPNDLPDELGRQSCLKEIICNPV